jgi:hypothetical protein
MESTFIYTLSDPITKEVRYIGKTNNPKRRLSAHVSRAIKENSNSHKNNWIRKILKEGNRPTIEVLEEVPVDNWEQHEVYWIEQQERGLFYRIPRKVNMEGMSITIFPFI